jgi:hypothetical protein
MMLPNRISGGRARPAVALLLVGCLVSFTLGQQLGYALRYPELHASTIPTAHAAGQLSGLLSAPSSQLSVPSGPSGQQARPIVTTPSHVHSAARAPAPAKKQSAASHGKKGRRGLAARTGMTGGRPLLPPVMLATQSTRKAARGMDTRPKPELAPAAEEP